MQQFLGDAARSVLDQELPTRWKLEWCLQFDGDRSSTTVEFDDPRVLRGVNTTHLGTGPTRNLAIARSSGDVLVQLDGDDILLPGALSSLLPHFDDDAIGWVVGRADDLLLDGSTEAFVPALLGHTSAGLVSQFWLDNHLLPFHSAGFSARRSLVLEAGGYLDLAAAEDVALVLAVTDTAPGRVIADPTTLYRKWPEQTTASSDYYTQLREECWRLIETAVRSRSSR
jgi:glycosyltransferase involved in cell wall biosynthesis